jgi:hypothetical protein
LCAEGTDLFLDFVFFDADCRVLMAVTQKDKTLDTPFIFKLKLELQTFYFDLALALMLQDALIRLTMFGWARIPGTGTVLRCFVRTEGGEVANYIAIRSTVKDVSMYHCKRPAMLTFHGEW